MSGEAKLGNEVAAQRGRRLSVTMLGGTDIKLQKEEKEKQVKQTLDRAGVVSRRRSIVSATETFDREVLNKLTDKVSFPA